MSFVIFSLEFLCVQGSKLFSKFFLIRCDVSKAMREFGRFLQRSKLVEVKWFSVDGKHSLKYNLKWRGLEKLRE